MEAEKRIASLDQDTPTSSERAYLAWRDDKVRRVLAEKATTNPEYKPIEAVAARYIRNAR